MISWWSEASIFLFTRDFTLISDIGHYFTGLELKSTDNISAGTDDCTKPTPPVQIFTFNYKIMRRERRG